MLLLLVSVGSSRSRIGRYEMDDVVLLVYQ